MKRQAPLLCWKLFSWWRCSWLPSLPVARISLCSRVFSISPGDQVEKGEWERGERGGFYWYSLSGVARRPGGNIYKKGGARPGPPRKTAWVDWSNGPACHVLFQLRFILAGGTVRQARHHGWPITVRITPAGPLSSVKAGRDAVSVHQSAAFYLCGTHLTQNLKQDFTSFLFSSCSPVSFLISSSYFLLHLSTFFLFGSFLIPFSFLLFFLGPFFFSLFLASSFVFCINLLLFVPSSSSPIFLYSFPL